MFKKIINYFSSEKTNGTTFSIPGLKDFYLSLHSQSEHVTEKMKVVDVWEPTETECVLNLLKEGGLFIDVGANVGYYTNIASQIVGPKGRVVSIEPDKRNFKLLKKNTFGSLDNVELINKAASEDEKGVRLYRSSWNFGDHRTYPTEDQALGSRIGSITIDKFLDGAKFKPTVVKIDCQGAEYSILKGMKGALSGKIQSPDVLIIEFWPYGLTNAGVEPEQFLKDIGRLNYKIWDIGRWNARPVSVNYEQIMDKLKNQLTIENQLFTNLLLIHNDSQESLSIMADLELNWK